MSTHNNSYQSEQLWNNWLQQAVASWEVGVVLCSYKKLSKDDMQKLACIWANEVDNYFGNVMRGKKYCIEQRIEKVQMLEYANDKRGWHVNALINKPEHIDADLFRTKLGEIWHKLNARKWQIAMLNKLNSTDLFWCEDVQAGFKRYALKQRTKTASEHAEIDTAEDTIITRTLTIHGQQPDFKKYNLLRDVT